MNENYEVLYQKIVGGGIPPKYSDPEEQGRQIKKCSILETVEIEYHSSNKIKQ